MTDVTADEARRDWRARIHQASGEPAARGRRARGAYGPARHGRRGLGRPDLGTRRGGDRLPRPPRLGGRRPVRADRAARRRRAGRPVPRLHAHLGGGYGLVRRGGDHDDGRGRAAVLAGTGRATGRRRHGAGGDGARGRRAGDASAPPAVAAHDRLGAPVAPAVRGHDRRAADRRGADRGAADHARRAGRTHRAGARDPVRRPRRVPRGGRRPGARLHRGGPGLRHDHGVRAAADRGAVVHAARPGGRPVQDGLRLRGDHLAAEGLRPLGRPGTRRSCRTSWPGTASRRCATTGRSRCGTRRTWRCSGAGRRRSSCGCTT